MGRTSFTFSQFGDELLTLSPKFYKVDIGRGASLAYMIRFDPLAFIHGPTRVQGVTRFEISQG